LSGKPAAASITAQNYPYVVSEYKTSAKGVAQPEVIGPDGTLVVDSAGVIQDAKAGTIGNTTQTDGLQEGINYARQLRPGPLHHWRPRDGHWWRVNKQ